jgi:hypothetical protein
MAEDAEANQHKAELMGEQKREGIKMKIKFSICVNEFWCLAQERGWLTKADAFKGQEVNNMVDKMNRGNNSIAMLEIKLDDVAEKIEEYSIEATKDEIASAMLTIVRMYTE